MTELKDVIVSFFDRRGDEFYTEPELAEFILESEWLSEQLDAAWREGEATGWSRAMRHMSDEPNLQRQTESPYRKAES